MSETIHPDDWPQDDRDDMLAAEYVLGVLPGDERQAAKDRAELDGAFAERIAAWEGRLAILNAAYKDGPVSPETYPRIEADLFPNPVPEPGTPAAAPSARSIWRLWFGGALTAALVALVVTFWPAVQPPLVAHLQGDALAFDASFRAGILEVAQSGPEAEVGHDYELWAIGSDGVPRSLGLLRGDRVEIPTELDEGITLAVSLEPEGGAPDGAPTGPVLMAGPLAYD
ncbi:anti-sigma factor [Cereibacter sphaeroides]|nr:anti-sigma factor [Cereibacter sphaeroides]